jgi:hypothetical protein
MTHLWHLAQNFFFSLGPRYGVNPWIFGVIYVGAIPLFWASVGWFVQSARRKQSLLLPALLSAFFFVSAYLYLIVVGRNVPLWVWLFLVAMVAVGAVGAVGKIRQRLK